jgi:hypothetical protein
VEGATAPDVLAVAVDLGVVAGPDTVAVPGPVGEAVEATGHAPVQDRQVPGAVLGERLKSLPVLDTVQGDQRLGDGVFFDVQR